MYISVKDKTKLYEYALEFQTIFDNDMSIRIFRYSFEKVARNPKYLTNKNQNEITLPESYLIVLEEEKDLEDYITLKINIPKAESFLYPIKVLRYWTYDLEKLYNENMYLLYPLQLFKLRKSMEQISNSSRSYKYKQNEMTKIYDSLKDTVNKTLTAIDKAYYDGKINILDFNEMNIIIDNLNCYFGDMYGKYGDIEEEVRFMVKSFYDPKVEEKGRNEGRNEGRNQGINEGIEKGRDEERENHRIKDVDRVLKLLKKKLINIDQALKQSITELNNDKLNLIIEDILDIDTTEDLQKYL